MRKQLFIHKMEQWRTVMFIDLLFCIVLMPLIIMLIPLERWIVKYPYFATVLFIFLYALYYTIRRYHVPIMLLHRKYKKFIAFMAVFLLCIFIMSHVPIPESVTSRLPMKLRETYRLQTVWMLSLIVIGFGFSVELMFELIRQVINRKDAEAERNKAELALYKAQINPHFLFNTLNSIYGLVISKSDRAERAVGMFADMLQYMYRHTKDETIPLGEEASYISHYIDLQQLRTTPNTTIVWETDIEDENLAVAPMLLITFVENAFKYGVSPCKKSVIEIRLSYRKDDGILRFRTRNTVVGPSSAEDASLVGIDNCRLRLNLLYPERHVLEAMERDGIFCVDLDIMFKS